MSSDIRKVKDMNGLIAYFADKLEWRIDVDDFDDIEDISYEFSAEDIGLKEEAFAKIKSLRQLPPLVDGQKWGIFCVEFDSKRFEVTALRKILSGLVPTRRNSAEHAVWDKKDLLFLCFWGTENERTIGVAHFQDKDSGLPQIKMISCAPSVEDFTQIQVFEKRLEQLKWPNNNLDHEKWASDWSEAFVTGYRQTIRDAATLTSQLAKEAQNIRNRIMDTLAVESSNGYVHLLFEKFKNTLIHDMKETEFADMYAQTVVYGLFSARCMDNTQEDFSADEAIDCIPLTNPFLKSLMKECLGSRNDSKLSFDELEIENVVELLKRTKTDLIIQDFNRQTGGGKEDPVIHFYEDFLTEYDKTQKVKRGVYYTPQPIVGFIVRAVDFILKEKFSIDGGLASTASKSVEVKRLSKKKIKGLNRTITVKKEVPIVQVLDPATGTGTFIRQVILQIYDDFVEENKELDNDELQLKWNEYVPKYLFPRINAYELMMAPYAVAHMKIAMVLKDTGYSFESNERLNVFLTNALEPAGNSSDQLTLFDDPLAIESICANKVKKNTGINVVLGNPPYAAESANNNDWIEKLVDDFKKEPGTNETLHERNYKAINDDYVKFIRSGISTISTSKESVIAFICNHAFIDNPTFRGMRAYLLQEFDEIYILNLHGNIMRKEIAENGSRDENVFDIQQGVSINLFVKAKSKNSGQAKVYYFDLLGARETKYQFLNEHNLVDIDWQEIVPTNNQFYFVPINTEKLDKYNEGFSVEQLMEVKSVCIVTSRDNLVISPNRDLLKEKMSLFSNLDYSDEMVNDRLFEGKLNLDSKSWNLHKARIATSDLDIDNCIKKITYRPFDEQYIFYHPSVVDRGREKVMQHMLAGDNIALIISRQAIADNWSHIQITKNIADNRVQYSNKGLGMECPLYLYSNECGQLKREPNLNPTIVNQIADSIRLSFAPEEKEKDSFTPLNIIDYVYAVLSSTKYRSKYVEFLKYDYPKVPFPKSREQFEALAHYGEILRVLHTGTEEVGDVMFCGNTPLLIKKVSYSNNTIFFDSDNYITSVPTEVWNYYYGGYQPLKKWIKDRKNRSIDLAELQNYIKTINALKKTVEVVKDIDRVISSLL